MQNLKLFSWKATNFLQQKQAGMLVIENVQEAKRYLLQQGLNNIYLQRHWQLNKKPKKIEFCDLLTQLAMLLQSSIPLKDSLQILLRNCVNISLNQWVRYILKNLEGGLSFSQSVAQSGLYFSYQERQLISVGEMTGDLASVCQQIAEHRQQALALQRKIQKILLYPMIVLSISIILTALLLIFIVPQFAEMYGSNQSELPFFTQLLLNISSFLQQYFFHMIAVSILFFYLIKLRLHNSYSFQLKKDWFLSHVPLLNKIIRLNRTISFCRSLGLMLNSGIPLQQSLYSFLPQNSINIQKKIEGDLTLINEVKLTLRGIEQGYKFSQSVSSNLFSIQTQQMLQVGEKSGNLGLILQHIAENQQQQLDHQIDLLSQMLEPFMMVIIGGLIGLIMLGMYLPIFNMGSLIQ
ncbi:type II secretion system F family protein [Histophilus somni]|uniref:Type II secretion system F family protein n=2 Tax=Histophilus somni TaxID=731 RepID=A0AAX2S4C7_HISSO|nr:type II secretion system F family protein [Histophilus somni]QEH08414.1 type II secretion system F family protein [Histophilus somni]QEH13006.1 type II secretion system F family protein [Histophilus somni]QEH24683.1 type II secretion system F family protein [Histophilus somni]QEH27491.1 type II secretion system F family protein [Histophilus somni]QEH51692.1 type II secretion system F family protein [Histophilus somni]